MKFVSKKPIISILNRLKQTRTYNFKSFCPKFIHRYLGRLYTYVHKCVLQILYITEWKGQYNSTVRKLYVCQQTLLEFESVYSTQYELQIPFQFSCRVSSVLSNFYCKYSTDILERIEIVLIHKVIIDVWIFKLLGMVCVEEDVCETNQRTNMTAVREAW